MTANPFRPTRYEHHNKPLLWLSPHARKLENEGSFYVSGARGSGKTSLLKTLHWRERLFNETLRAQVGNRPTSFLSIYFRIPDHISFALAEVDWNSVAPEAPNKNAVAFSYFSALIESIAAQQIFEALEEHNIAEAVVYSAADAERRIEGFLRRYSELRLFSTETINTYGKLAAAFDAMQRRINVAATRGHVREMIQRLPVFEPGALIHDAAAVAAGQFNKPSEGGIPFQVKVCLDDCEVLRKNQQMYLNALVRKAQAPLSWIVSYIGHDYEATSGLYKDHNLTDADRKVVNLDEPEESSFVRFCEAVSSLRVFYSLPVEEQRDVPAEEVDKIFSLENVLGRFQVNELIDFALKNSLSQAVEDFKTQAASLAESTIGQGADKRHRALSQIGSNDVALPYYQTYLLSKLVALKDIASLSERDSGELYRLAAYLRRKQRAAFISICADYGVKNIPYAGMQVVFGLSDGCIRDYLEIMAEIYDAFDQPESKLSRFFKRRNPLTIDTQRRGIQKSSETKFAGIAENIETNAVELSRLVECLGELTALLQRNVRTAERGMFLVDFDEIHSSTTPNAEQIKTVIRSILGRGESDGILRSDTGPDNDAVAAEHSRVTRFRLHRRFAPKFGFSFRGPYATAKLPIEKIAEIFLHAETVDAKRWAEQMFERVGSVSLDQRELSFPDD